MSVIPNDLVNDAILASLEYHKSELQYHEKLIHVHTDAAEANKQAIRSLECTLNAAQQQHQQQQQQQLKSQHLQQQPPQQSQSQPQAQHQSQQQSQRTQPHNQYQHNQQQQHSSVDPPKRQQRKQKKSRNTNNNGLESNQSANYSTTVNNGNKPISTNYTELISDAINKANNLSIDNNTNTYETVNYGRKIDQNVELAVSDNVIFGGDVWTQHSRQTFQTHSPSIDNEVKECVNDVVNDVSYPTFKSMNLRMELMKGIEKYGFTDPTQLQRTVIIPCIEGVNAIVEGKRAIGKTSALLIALLQKVDPKLKECQSLVLFPRRALAQEAHKQIRALAIYMNVYCEIFLGAPHYSNRNSGNPQKYDIHDDIDKLRNGAQIALLTPGRTVDLIERRAINFANIKIIVLDNCESFFENNQFFYQLTKIFNALQMDTQILFFGDQIKFDLLEFANKSVPNYRIIKDKDGDIQQMMERNVQRNKHYYIYCEPKDRFTYVLLIMATFRKQVVIFTFDSKQAERLEEQLLAHNTYKIAKLHRTMPKKRQTDIINEFIEGNANVIVTYPDSLRGISMNHFPLVVNYSMPALAEDYAKRIGEKTTSISIITDENQMYKMNIEKHFKINFADFAPYIIAQK